MTTIEEVVAGMPEAKVFSVLDATSGYWQVRMDEESSKLCTFNKRLSFGIKSAPEVFQQTYARIVWGHWRCKGHNGRWEQDKEQHDLRLKQMLAIVCEVNLKFNSRIYLIRQEEVPYVGHVLSKDGLKPELEKIHAV